MIISNKDNTKFYDFPRSPLTVRRDAKRAESFAQKLYHESLLTHCRMLRSPATLEHGLMLEKIDMDSLSTRAITLMPPDSYTMKKFVLGYFPKEVSACCKMYNIHPEVLTDRAMDRYVLKSFSGGKNHGKIIGLNYRDRLLVDGVFSKNENRIVLRGSTRQFLGTSYNEPTQWQNVEDILGHEIGHLIDFLTGGISETQDFFDVFCAERHMLDSYSRSNPHEYFATAIWITHRFAKQAEEYIPFTKRFLDEMDNDMEWFLEDLIAWEKAENGRVFMYTH